MDEYMSNLTSSEAIKYCREKILENPQAAENILRDFLTTVDESVDAIDASYSLRSLLVTILINRCKYSDCSDLLKEMKDISRNNKVSDILSIDLDTLEIILDLKQNINYGQNGVLSNSLLSYLTQKERFSSFCEDVSEYYAEHGNIEIAFRFWDVYTHVFSSSLLLIKYQWTYSTIPLVDLYLPNWLPEYYSHSTIKVKRYITEQTIRLCELSLENPTFVNLPLQPGILTNVYNDMMSQNRKRKLKTLERVMQMIENKRDKFQGFNI